MLVPILVGGGVMAALAVVWLFVQRKCDPDCTRQCGGCLRNQ